MQANLKRWLVLFVLLMCGLMSVPAVAADLSSSKAQAQREETQPGNNQPFWSDVRGGDNPYQTTQVRGIESSILIQPAGETWRAVRNNLVTVYGGWLIVAAMILIGLFYLWKGSIKLQEKPTGRMILRFNAWDRIVHWATAISFVLLAVTGIIILFGKHIVLPLLGYTVFAWLAVLAKNIHNFVGPVFAFCVIVMFVTFVKDNFPRAHDLKWIANLARFSSAKKEVPSGRFNAGEKAWFWGGVALLGIVVSVTGFVLNFPNFEQGRSLMQLANVIHAVGAVIFMSASLGHIYLGTIGMEGAYDGMRDGYVDETWAKEHHELWYREVMSGSQRGGTASPAVATSLKEGWKL